MLTIVFALIVGISCIILLSARFKMHPFFSLFIACFVTGWIGGIDAAALLTNMKEGFGRIMSSLGFIIALGTVLGLVLEANGATTAMASAIIKWAGSKRTVLAMSLTGFMVGLPIFCDSGYVVLSGLNQSMIRKTRIPTAVMSTAMATGLYAVHCFIPPHPGVTAATGTVNADFGRVIVYGLLIAVPAMLAGYYWAMWQGKKFGAIAASDPFAEPTTDNEKLPGTFLSFLPVLIPIVLIALRAMMTTIVPVKNTVIESLLLVGDPAIALAIGVVLALCIPKKWERNEWNKLAHHGLEKAGGILMIIGAGGAFGAVISALKIQDHLAGMEGLDAWGLFFPFLVATILKTAQGSSTVAILTAASIVVPFLPALHLDDTNGRVIAVLAMGAGSMAISHVNDAYFWVITNFSGQELKPVLRVYSMATICMAVVAIIAVYLLSLIIL
ncbi:GntP family permease [Niabella soli]|uniref:Gluconate transporter n=1 Tax=Niabella soli DSM 19437 TaxID=929713 RepID=W0F537_9BACT|nr:GntP family permease [Niabella soli]AHF16446.1 gluconate transporter [Niabella soli DSM 19437]